MLKAYFESKEIIEFYKNYRPHYGQQVADHVLNELKKSSGLKGKFDLMVEVGCGGGQATNVFAPYFNRVLATDISQEQIEDARKQNKQKHVLYDIGRAEEVDVEDGSVDLLLAAEAAHWFDFDKFHVEASRILKPDGCLALIGYLNPKLEPKVGLNKTIDASIFATNLLNEIVCEMTEICSSEEQELENGYTGIMANIPPNNIKRFSVVQSYDWTLAELKGFIRSIEAYPMCTNGEMATNGSSGKADIKSLDVADVFGNTLKQTLNISHSSDEEVQLKVDFEMFVIVAHHISGFETSKDAYIC